jgi:chromosome partitioning protein
MTWASVAAEAGHTAPTTIAMNDSMHRDGQLAKVAEPFDHVVIDTPPRFDRIQRSALVVADVVVLPCGPSATDAWALASTVELIEEARTVRPNLRPAVLLTRVQSTTTIGRGAREVVAEGGLPVLSTMLGYRVAYQEALAAGLGPTTYARASEAASEIRELVDELLAFARGSKLRALAGGRK